MTGIYGVSIAIFTVIAGSLTMHGAAWYQITGWWMAILGGISAILVIFVLKNLYRTYVFMSLTTPSSAVTRWRFMRKFWTP